MTEKDIIAKKACDYAADVKKVDNININRENMMKKMRAIEINENDVDSKISYLKIRNLNEKASLKLLKIMPEILLLSPSELDKRLIFVYEKEVLGVVILFLKNSYVWAEYNNIFGEFTKGSREKDNILVQMVIEIAQKEYINQKQANDMNLQQKVYKLKQENFKKFNCRIS